jgi:hypothetical protein
MDNITNDEMLYLELLIAGRPPETLEEIDAVLRVEGYDPEKVAEKAHQLVRGAIGVAKKRAGIGRFL